MTIKNETPIQRLERLRAEAAARTATSAPAPLPVSPGDTIHSKRTGTTFATGTGFLSASHITRAGESICLTQAMIDASYDVRGFSWLSIVGDDAAQLAKWGEVRFGIGPAPVGAKTWNVRGDADWSEQREAARREAWSQPTQQARTEALAAVERRFGPPVPTSTTLNSTPDPSIRLAEEQRARLDAGGVRMVSHYTAVEPGAPLDENGDRR